MARVHRWQEYMDGTPNMGSKRFDTERSEVENLVINTYVCIKGVTSALE